MRREVLKAVGNKDFQLWARDAVRSTGVELRDPHAVARGVRRYVETHLVFVRDPFGIESIMSPLQHMAFLKGHKQVGGDCDDAATLSASLALALGLRAIFVIEAYDWGKGPSPYQHVYSIVRGPGQSWKVNMDTTRDAQGLPPKVARRFALVV